MHLPILLASSSPYRRELLSRLRLSFMWESPDIDETPHPNESAAALVHRLSYAKADALREKYPNTLIIGSDQVAVRGQNIIGKPHTHERASEQLRQASGQRIDFKTGLCLLNTATATAHIAVEEFSVTFRHLSDEQINHYLLTEKPYDCAGSFKCEGLGIALFSQLSGNDPNALIGLPLIRLVDMLQQEGVDPLLLASPPTTS